MLATGELSSAFRWPLALKEGKGHLEHEATLPIYPPPPPPEEHPPPPPPKPPLVSHPHFFMAWGQDLPPVAPSSKDFPDHRKEVLSFQPPPPPAVETREKAQPGVTFCVKTTAGICRKSTRSNHLSWKSSSAPLSTYHTQGWIFSMENIKRHSYLLSNHLFLVYRVFPFSLTKTLLKKNSISSEVEQKEFSERGMKTHPSPALHTTYSPVTHFQLCWLLSPRSLHRDF